jgi:hypothetical protein
MTRLLAFLFAAGLTAGCTHTPTTAHEQCHVESGWLDSSNGCSEREGYPDCWKVCADGTRVRVGSQQSASESPH